MNMQSILVPDYVAKTFNAPLRHPNPAPDAVDRSVERVYKLIDDALQGIATPQWEVNDGQYGSQARNEPIGFHRVGDKFYVYAEERGRRDALAIFNDDHLGAKYFVFLVSKGTRIIDWSKFLEMEP